MLSAGRKNLRRTLSWLCAIVAFASVCVGIRQLFPREVQGVSAKLRSFAEQKDKIDVVFLGSSRVFHGIAPEVFDQTMQARGYELHSFNAGFDSLGTGEGFAIMHRLLALHPHKLRYLFLELGGGIDAGIPTRDDVVTERNVYWRDAGSLVSTFRVFALGLSAQDQGMTSAPFSLGRLLFYGPLLSEEVRLWGQNQTNFGRGFDLMQRAWATLSGHPIEAEQPPPQNWDGFFAMSFPMNGKTLSEYRQDLANVRNGVFKRSPDPVMRREVDYLRRFLQTKRIQLVLVVPPSVSGSRGGGINAPAGPWLFSYDDYQRHPEFYQEDNRMDPEHLNARGAELFTRALANDFATALGAGRR